MYCTDLRLVSIIIKEQNVSRKYDLKTSIPVIISFYQFTWFFCLFLFFLKLFNSSFFQLFLSISLVCLYIYIYISVFLFQKSITNFFFFKIWSINVLWSHGPFDNGFGCHNNDLACWPLLLTYWPLLTTLLTSTSHWLAKKI